MKRNKRYIPEFKGGAVELLATGKPVQELARKSGISASLLDKQSVQKMTQHPTHPDKLIYRDQNEKDAIKSKPSGFPNWDRSTSSKMANAAYRKIHAGR